MSASQGDSCLAISIVNSIAYPSFMFTFEKKEVFLAYWGCRGWPVTVAGVLCQLVSKRDGSFMPFVRAGWWVALPWALGEEIIIGLRVNVYPLPWRSVRYMYLRIKLQNYIL